MLLQLCYTIKMFNNDEQSKYQAAEQSYKLGCITMFICLLITLTKWAIIMKNSLIPDSREKLILIGIFISTWPLLFGVTSLFIGWICVNYFSNTKEK